MSEVSLVVTDHGPPERARHTPATLANVELEIGLLGAGRKSVELRASPERSLSVTGGQGGWFIVGAELPHGWSNALPRDRQEGMVELVAGGQRANYSRAHCVSLAVALAAAREFLESGGERLTTECRWDNPAPTEQADTGVEEWYGDAPRLHANREPRFATLSGSTEDAIPAPRFAREELVRQFLAPYLSKSDEGGA